jgi:hypothetical protein
MSAIAGALRSLGKQYSHPTPDKLCATQSSMRVLLWAGECNGLGICGGQGVS